MKVICKNCGKKLPKRSDVCDNCGLLVNQKFIYKKDKIKIPGNIVSIIGLIIGIISILINVELIKFFIDMINYYGAYENPYSYVSTDITLFFVNIVVSFIGLIFSHIGYKKKKTKKNRIGLFLNILSLLYLFIMGIYILITK